MKRLNQSLTEAWKQLGPGFLPFADAASADLPLSRLLRLGLFQVSVGMSVVLLTGTLNRVMIVELGISTWLVALMVSIPIIFAPLRALIGHRSDNHKSYLGWRRGPYIWFGSLLQFGGLSIMPFALLILSGDTHGPLIVGHISAALAFLLVGAGLHTTQTAGLALASDLSSEENRPRVVALLYVMLLLGMVVSALVFGALLADFGKVKLIQVIQGCAVVTVILNVIALWKQEVRNPELTAHNRPRPTFREAWQAFSRTTQCGRLLITVGLGTAAFSMQDILLEPYGGQVLGLSVSETTALTAMLAGGNLLGFALAAHLLGRGTDPYRLAAMGVLAGIAAFSAVIFADPMGSVTLFRAGTALIGFGTGLFVVGTLTGAMNLAETGQGGLALGAWGAVQATATGVAIALGGALRDVFSGLAERGALGPALTDASAGYGFVYHLEILLLFATLVAIGPLVKPRSGSNKPRSSRLGLAEFPS